MHWILSYNQVIFSVIVSKYAILLSSFQKALGWQWREERQRVQYCTAVLTLSWFFWNNFPLWNKSQRTLWRIAIYNLHVLLWFSVILWSRELLDIDTCILTLSNTIDSPVINSILRYLSYSYAIFISRNKFWNHTWFDF